MSPAPALPATTSLAGVDLHQFDLPGLIEYLIATSELGDGGYVLTPNVDHLRAIAHDPGFRELALSADIRVPDGMPLLWAGRLQGTPFPGRVAGSDLIWSLPEALARHERSLFLMGGDPGTAERTAAALKAANPDLQIVGTHFLPFGFEHDPPAVVAAAAILADSRPDFVLLALPMHKGIALGMKLRSQFPKTWFINVGISFSFVSGEVVRAPRWMQKTGLEWVHRMCQEPRRLARRYLLEDLPFALLLLARATRHRSASHKP